MCLSNFSPAGMTFVGTPVNTVGAHGMPKGPTVAELGRAIVRRVELPGPSTLNHKLETSIGLSPSLSPCLSVPLCLSPLGLSLFLSQACACLAIGEYARRVSPCACLQGGCGKAFSQSGTLIRNSAPHRTLQ